MKPALDVCSGEARREVLLLSGSTAPWMTKSAHVRTLTGGGKPNPEHLNDHCRGLDDPEAYIHSWM